MDLWGDKMIQKYYNSIIEQVYDVIGKQAHNVSLAKYSNDFSLASLNISEEITQGRDIYFASYEFKNGEWAGAYEPFLDIIRELFSKYCSKTLEEFMVDCGVYYLHRPLILTYFETDEAKRSERLLMGETEYEDRKSVV